MGAAWAQQFGPTLFAYPFCLGLCPSCNFKVKPKRDAGPGRLGNCQVDLALPGRLGTVGPYPFGLPFLLGAVPELQLQLAGVINHSLGWTAL